MVTHSIRCHAAVIDGKVLKNVVVSYKGTPCGCSDFEIRPFSGEIHSTVDFNGAFVVTPALFEFHSGDYELSPDNFSLILEQIASSIPPLAHGDGVNLCFMEL